MNQIIDCLWQQIIQNQIFRENIIILLIVSAPKLKYPHTVSAEEGGNTIKIQNRCPETTKSDSKRFCRASLKFNFTPRQLYNVQYFVYQWTPREALDIWIGSRRLMDGTKLKPNHIILTNHTLMDELILKLTGKSLMKWESDVNFRSSIVAQIHRSLNFY